jgi:hypothetical protein
MKDILLDPGLAERILSYQRCIGTPTEYLDFAEALVGHEEQVYPDVNVAQMGNLLRIEATGKDAIRTRRMAAEVLTGKRKIRGYEHCGTIAPLLILRFGDRRSLSLLRTCITVSLDKLPPGTLRAAALVFASYGPTEARELRKLASKLWNNYLAEMVRLLERMEEYKDVPDRFKNRVKLQIDSVAGTKYVDMRALLTLRLLRLSNSRQIDQWISQWKRQVKQDQISAFDRRLIDRLL